MRSDVNEALSRSGCRTGKYDRLGMVPCPPEGTGVHKWLFATACAMARSGVSEAEAATFLEENAARNDPREIADAVHNAYTVAQAGGRWIAANRYSPRPRQQTWPNADAQFIDRIDSTGYGLVDLWEESPMRIDPGTEPCQVLALLFAPGDLLTAAVVREAARTVTFSEWAESLNRCRLIVPNVAAAPQGLTRNGRPSQRAKCMYPNRSHLVVEFDSGTLDQQAARIRYLATKAPLVLVVFSGSKSLHAWFRCHGIEDPLLRPLFAEACRLGADQATWQPHQLVRLPEGIREGTQTRQSVYYLNPSRK